jgi:hypothetical protein
MKHHSKQCHNNVQLYAVAVDAASSIAVVTVTAANRQCQGVCGLGFHLTRCCKSMLLSKGLQMIGTQLVAAASWACHHM